MGRVNVMGLKIAYILYSIKPLCYLWKVPHTMCLLFWNELCPNNGW